MNLRFNRAPSASACPYSTSDSHRLVVALLLTSALAPTLGCSPSQQGLGSDGPVVEAGVATQGSEAGPSSSEGCTTCEPETTSGASTAFPVSSTEVATNPSDAGLESIRQDAGEIALEPWLEAEPLFSSTAISRVSLRLGESEQEALRADSATYVHGDLEVELGDQRTITLSDIGVRLKGQWGSARNLDQKAAFLLKMNEFVKGQKLLGLTKLALNNMVQDSSMIHEQLAYLLFREMGIAAPRTGYATVSINTELFGLYSAVEVVDNESFLDHWYASDQGNLYEGAYGSDIEGDRIDSYDQDRGDDVAFADLYALQTNLDNLGGGANFMTDGAPYLDTSWFANFVATELMLSHWDGYAVTRNNYFLYPSVTGRWTFIPWGTDQTFGDSGYDIWQGDARVQRLCTASQDCRSAMAGAYDRLLALWTELDLLTRVDALENLIRDAVVNDPRREYGEDSVWASIEQVRQFLRDRPASVQNQLLCADPSTVDNDGDGASGCGEDCDDNNPVLYPGAPEACNWADDNCNGEVDEDPMCPSCMATDAFGGGHYAFCVHPLPFAEAQADCEQQGGNLVSIHSQEEQDAMLQAASALGSARDFWIGLTDANDESNFVWTDGSPVDYTNWGGGEPNDSNNEDCAQLTSWGGWNDLNCEGWSLAYVCKTP